MRTGEQTPFLSSPEFDRNYPLVLTLFSLYGHPPLGTWWQQNYPFQLIVLFRYLQLFSILSCNLLYQPMWINHWSQINGNIMKLVPFNIHNMCHYTTKVLEVVMSWAKDESIDEESWLTMKLDLWSKSINEQCLKK